MATYKVAELEGALLDAAVAKAEGLPFVLEPRPGLTSSVVCALRRDNPEFPELNRSLWAPSTSWLQGGPIIEREHGMVAPELMPDRPLYWVARMGRDLTRWQSFGPTPLIAAMRAYVASKLGEKVELP
jgi:hypothetical protein